MAPPSLTPWRDKPETQTSTKRHKRVESLLCLTVALICLGVAFLPNFQLDEQIKWVLAISLLILLGGMLTVCGQCLRSYEAQDGRRELIAAGLRRYVITMAVLAAACFFAYRYFWQ